MHRSDILAVPAYGIMRQGLSMPLVAQPGLVTRIGKIPRNALIFIHHLDVHNIRMGMRFAVEAIFHKHIPVVVAQHGKVGGGECIGDMGHRPVIAVIKIDVEQQLFQTHCPAAVIRLRKGQSGARIGVVLNDF